MSKQHLHICHSLELGGISTLVNALIDLNSSSSIIHHVLVWQIKSNNEKNVIDISKQKDKRHAFNDVIKDYDVFFVHSLKPFMIPSLLPRKKDVYLFQHGITFGSGISNYIKRFYYFVVINVLKFKVICSSGFAKKKLLRNIMVLTPSLIRIVPFGITMIRSKEISKTTEMLKIGFVGRLVNQKRIHYIFDAFQQLECNADIEFRIAGTGPLKKDLEDLSLKFKEKNVNTIFDGHVKDINLFLSKIDLLILPSKEESFGLVVIEAFSQNVPAIVFSDTGTCVEFVNENINGFIVNDTIELANLLCVLKSTDRRKILKQKLRDLDLSLYDILNTRQILDQL